MTSPSPENSPETIAPKPLDIEPLTQTDAPFPVVRIAASAGGLEAFTELIRHLPTDTGMAFVLIQHLSPDHESLLSEILGRITEMPVHQVQDQMVIEPNHVYVIPPNTQMTLGDGIFHLAPRQRIQGYYMPGDVFLGSLAVDRGNKAIAVVLSGMDSDGSQGVKAVKVAGGVTFAQCESSARFDSMPTTAVATGSVDFVLPPQAIATELAKLSRSPFLHRSEPIQVEQELAKPGNALTIIFALLRTTTGVDFTLYKSTTIDRRMQRRMLLYKLESLEEYAQYLREHPAEVQALYEEILIHVTSFFRDSETFEQLKTQVFPTISQNKTADTPLRIWVAGCSTGEEVYSIAICLVEFFSDRATMPPIQIFATDISEAALNKARTSFYLENQLGGVSPERLDRFFVPTSGGYQISSSLRELCIFARHNLGSDPPFSNLDLISCRNVLIYLSDSLQERIISLFHYSLNLTGFLMLGASESVKTASDLFTSVHESTKIYARKLTLTRPLFSFTARSYPVTIGDSQKRIVDAIAHNFDLAREVDQLISNRYAPVSVVVNDQTHVLHLRGDTDPYLRLPAGTTDLNLLMMARDGLMIPLRTAIYQAQSQNTSVRQEKIQLELNERLTCLNLEVIPFQPTIANVLYFLVIFEAVSPPVTPLTSTLVEDQEPEDLEREIIQLRQALAASTQRELSAQASFAGRK
ncbi:MAG TPA: chemotaxis protein CheB [Coleofasciculaceae cyanobacterium]|jgi:two-component system CheB/CheR fusion protein